MRLTGRQLIAGGSVASAVAIATLVFGIGARMVWAQADPGANSQTAAPSTPATQADGASKDSYAGRVHVDAISDTQGVDFGPYLLKLETHLRASWPAFLPDTAKNVPAGSVSVEFEIPPDGKSGKSDPQIQSTSGDAGIDKGAIYAVRYWKPFDPLPAEFHGTGLKVRATFSFGKSLDSTSHETPPKQGAMPSFQGMGSGVEILSDTQGVDFKNYVNRMLASIKRNWIAVMPEKARMGARGAAVVTFSILPDGSISTDSVQLERASGEKDFDHAALDALQKSEPLEPLPKQFHGPVLKLRLEFLYNMTPQELGFK